MEQCLAEVIVQGVESLHRSGISAGLVTQLEISACYEGLTEVILVDVLS